MAYVILDPIGDYAAYLKKFLDTLKLPAIAVFSSQLRQSKWQHKWRHILGDYVLADYVITDATPVADVARMIRGEHGDDFYGIVPWDEMHTLVAAQLAEALDLAWNSPSVIECFRDKAVMKARLREHGGVRINAAQRVEEPEEAIAFQQQVGSWPIVVKPSGGAGAMSVYFPESRAELLRDCRRVFESGLGEVLLEEYIGGDEFAVNGLVDSSGDFLVTDVWYYDKRESHGIPNLYYQSIKVHSHEEPFQELAGYAAEVIDALGLTRSPVHMEVKVDDSGPCLIEVGARMAGGDQPVLASKLHHHSLFELAACHYLDELPFSHGDVDYRHYDSFSARILSGIQPVAIPRVRAVLGYREVQELPSFEGFGFIWPPGTGVPVTRDLGTKSWEVYLLHPNARQVEHDAQLVRRLLHYR